MPTVSQVELLERESELAAVDDLLDSAVTTTGGSLLVEGPAGIGKTRLLAAAAARADERGIRVLSARATELERDFPFGVVHQLFGRAVAEAPQEDRDRLLRGAAALAKPLFDKWIADDAEASDALYPRLHGLYWLTANLASVQPLLLVADDVHWADAASLRFFTFLLPRLTDLRAGLLLGARPAEAGERSQLVDEIAVDRATRCVRPQPLSPAAVAKQVESVLANEPAEAFVHACHRATGGNPFLLTELLTELANAGIEPIAAEAAHVRDLAPDTVSRAVLVRLARLPISAQRIARAVAILGDETSLQRAARLAEVEPDAAANACGALAAAAIFDGSNSPGFSHPLLRSAIYSELPGPERARLHQRAAAMLAEEAEAPEAVATHLLATEPAGDHSVVETLRGAADRATARGAPDAAITYLRRALAEPPSRGARTDLMTALVAAALAAGDVSAAAEAGDLIGDLSADPAAIARSMPQLGLFMIAAGCQDEAVTMVEQAIDALWNRDRDLALRLEAESWLLSRWDQRASQRADDRLLRYRPGGLSGATAGERLVLAALANAVTYAGADAAEAAAFAERGLAAGAMLREESSYSVPFQLAVHTLIRAERFDLAERELDKALADARRRGSALAFGLASSFRSHLFLRRGDVVQAELEGRNATEVARMGGWTATSPLGLAYLADALIERGALGEAGQLLADHGFEGEIPEGHLFFALQSSRGRLRIAEGHVEEGLADLHEVGARRRRWRAINPAVDRWASHVAVGLKHHGDLDRALELAEEELRQARTWNAPGTLGAATRTLGLVRGGDDGVELLRDAITILESSDARLEHAHALIELGAALRRGNRRSDSRAPLETGHQLAQECGATALADRARHELAALGARPRKLVLAGVDELTASERRVAQMAADGLSNPEIAQALFVTVKTIETHLSRVYRKLDISSRKQLSGALQR